LIFVGNSGRIARVVLVDQVGFGLGEVFFGLVQQFVEEDDHTVDDVLLVL
jgi:hypothetical protein